MPEFSTDPQIVTLDPAVVAVVRETVPISELSDFFGRGFHAVMDAAQTQRIALVGPPVGVYFGAPSETVDVAAGFPTAQPVADDDGAGITSVSLPGGRAVQILHMGSYDSMEQTYARLMAWVGEQGLAPAELMWESYLTEPNPEAPESMQTLITWPLAG
jgi:effector-binding domain-containing protein